MSVRVEEMVEAGICGIECLWTSVLWACGVGEGSRAVEFKSASFNQFHQVSSRSEKKRLQLV